MNDNPPILEVKTWLAMNAGLLSRIVSLAFLVFGILAVIGAIKNWDWLYKADVAYHNKWTIGQISRYLGRNTARVCGFVGGLLLILAGAVWSYMAFTKK
jgi:Immunity protein 17